MIRKEDELRKESLSERLVQKDMQAEHERENFRRQRMLVANAHSQRSAHHIALRKNLQGKGSMLSV